METKPVDREEMSNLLLESRKENHPYFYKFEYSTKQKSIIASRIKKESHSDISERTAFHRSTIDTSNPLGLARKRIEIAKNKMGEFSYATE